MNNVENIKVFKAIDVGEFSVEQAQQVVRRLRKFFAGIDLTKSISVEIAEAEVEGIGGVKDYSFLAARRFTVNGVLYIGGHNGEILNTEDYVTSVYRSAQQ